MKEDIKLFRVFVISVVCYIAILYSIALVVEPVDGSGTIDLQGGTRKSMVQQLSSSKAGDAVRVSPVNLELEKECEIWMETK